MARFTLQPCKLREDRFVPTSEPPITLGWPELRTRLAPTGSIQALMTLRRSRIGAFVGLIRHPYNNIPTTFLFLDNGRPKNLAHHIKKDNSIPDRIIEVYRMESVLWDDRCLEFEGE